VHGTVGKVPEDVNCVNNVLYLDDRERGGFVGDRMLGWLGGVYVW
jgi:hypothetical protein